MRNRVGDGGGGGGRRQASGGTGPHALLTLEGATPAHLKYGRCS